MKNSGIFLDRDGVINIDKNYVYKVENLEFIPGSIKALEILQNKGYLLFIVTNQSGIGRGYYSEEDYLKLRKKINEILLDKNIMITEELYCPHHPDKNCKCRKPNPYHINQLIEKYDLDKKKCYMIGDKTSDIKAGENAGIKTILVKTGKAGNDKKYNINPDYVCKDLLEASELI